MDSKPSLTRRRFLQTAVTVAAAGIVETRGNALELWCDGTELRANAVESEYDAIVLRDSIVELYYGGRE